ncbi:MAG TPA: phosphatase PAP2 family protein [Bacteroidia bacterium]|jgi:membrane-associated phospholipid phosphatase|nr:phosphatase PAP2 family protein [Bacteroidia bacterium]
MKTNRFTYKITFTLINVLCSHLVFCISSGTNKSPADTNKIFLYDTLVNKKRTVYKLKPVVDIPIVAVCGGWSGYLLLTQIYSKGPSTQQQIMSLDINSINPIDRMAVYPYNASLDKNSYYPFYAAFPLPLVFFLTGNNMRSDFPKLAFLYLETLSVTGLFGTSATNFVNQYRPYAYTSSTSIEQKVSQNSKNSFYAGHVEIIATSTFFLSEVYSSYYPESKIKWLFFVLSGAATAGMGYARITAGMHFPSDVLLGAGVGASSGILVPYFHNHKIIKNSDLSFAPYGDDNTYGLSVVYKF